MKKRITLPIIGCCVAALFVMFLGVYEDREFGDLNLFIKHRPTMKVYFFAPIGESNARLDDLTARLQFEEKAYRQYVEEGRGYLRHVRITS